MLIASARAGTRRDLEVASAGRMDGHANGKADSNGLRADDEPPEHLIRPASLRDLDVLVRLEEACFPHAEDRFSRRRIRGLLLNRRAPVLIYEHNGRAMGNAVGLIRQHTSGVSARIYSVAVHPQARGLGAGRRLAEALLTRFSEAGARRTYLEVRVDNIPAISLYVSLGFRQVCTLPDYYAPGQHGLSFCRPLDLGDAALIGPTLFDQLEAKSLRAVTERGSG